jgi:hypothetical protein
MVPIRMQIPINPYPIPLQPPTNKLIIIIAMLISTRVEKPALRYLPFFSGIKAFRTLEATINRMLIPKKIKIKTPKAPILPLPPYPFECIIVILFKKAAMFTKTATKKSSLTLSPNPYLKRYPTPQIVSINSESHGDRSPGIKQPYCEYCETNFHNIVRHQS